MPWLVPVPVETKRVPDGLELATADTPAGLKRSDGSLPATEDPAPTAVTPVARPRLFAVPVETKRVPDGLELAAPTADTSEGLKRIDGSLPATEDPAATAETPVGVKCIEWTP